MDRGRRFDDGEVVRYGAGESWRPTPRGGERERSPPPRRPRSPARDRDRSRPRSPRARSPIVPGSDSYVPGRYAPRRRSQSRGPIGGGDRYRRERSRDRESPRRRDRTRSPPRRLSSPRRSPSRRAASPPRRASPGRGDRYNRPRSPPRRDWDRDRDRARDRDWDRERDWRPRDRSRERDFGRRDERRRSRSPFGRDRRDRSPASRGTPPTAASQGGSYRPSRSPSNRRGDRFQSFRRSPPRDSGPAPTMNSQPPSQRPSPRPGSVRARSPLPPSGEQSPAYPAPAPSRPALSREPSRSTVNDFGPNIKSPPRGPAALRAPPTGPAASRTMSTSSPSPLVVGSKPAHTPGSAPRSEVSSPTNPPAGPRGYVPPARGAYPPRGGGRGAWSQGPPSAGGAPPNIPTGPRGSSASSTPTQGRPFNPPTGPAAAAPGGPRQSLAQSLLSTMPPIVPGGKLDPTMTPVVSGVTRDLEPHYRKLRDEEEKLRDELRAKSDRLRRSLYLWDRLGRESRAWEMRSDLSEKSMKNLAGEGMGGAAF